MESRETEKGIDIMVMRKIVEIDEDLCDGCGECVIACHERAIEIVDGKAKVISDRLCDGFGDCIGECPTGALSIVEKDVERYDEEAVKERLKESREEESGPFTTLSTPRSAVDDTSSRHLINWPIQIALAPGQAPYFDHADLLIAADCCGFAHPSIHNAVEGKITLIGCPKLYDSNFYVDKLTEIFRKNDIHSITVLHMEVPCCSRLNQVLDKALRASSKDIPVERYVVGTKGNIWRE